MTSYKSPNWILFGILIVLSIDHSKSVIKECDRRPPATSSPKSPDNGYKILVSGNPSHYVPGQTYTVILRGHKTYYIEQKFTGFTLVVEPKGRENIVEKKNVGKFHLFGESLTKMSTECPNTVLQTSVLPKPEIRAKWIAPPAGSGCVLFKATIIEKPEVWYMDDGGLTKELCEKEEDANEQPTIIEDCCACDEAKYEVTFEGLWSRHTHPKDFPTNLQLVHFSDIIGASHSADFRMWEYGGKASPGVKDLAEYGATKRLESELKSESNWIRTIIKARGLWYPTTNGKTFAVFRVDRKHHLMSLLSMLGPSPDWVVGVSALELCTQNCSWVSSKTLDLYPWDAGTDSGITYMSDNNATFPQEQIRRITNTYPENEKSPFYNPKMKMKPLAKLTISRKRIYTKACGDVSEPSTWVPEVSGNPDPAIPECAVTNWSPFSSCPVTCGPGIVMRTRSYINEMKASMFDCQAQLTEKKMCEDSPSCNSPQNNRCRTSLWGEWSECGVSCGKGFRMRQRNYLSRKARKFCTEPLTEKEMCLGKVPECPRASKVMNPECAVTQWSEWSPCTVTCGKGFKIRTRLYLRIQRSDNVCSEELMQKQPCMADRIDCRIGPAEAKEVCVKKREVGPCRGYFPRWYYDVTKGLCLQFVYGGCRGNQNNFEHYVECKQVCEMIKVVIYPPLKYPMKYAYEMQDANPSAMNPNCGSLQPHVTHQPASVTVRPQSNGAIDCMVTEWSTWTQCSRTCGRGRRERRRMIKAQPKNGGAACPVKLIQKRKCRNNKPCPVNCILGEWTAWSDCSQTCGEAVRKRTRPEIKRPRHGGKVCEPTVQSRYCDLEACPLQPSLLGWDSLFR